MSTSVSSFGPVISLGHIAVTTRREDGGLSAKQFAVAVRHCAVAFAGSCFEPGTIEDGDLTAAVVNEVLLLQLPRSHGDATPTHAEHIGEKLMGEVEMIGLRPIVGHQQPARQPWLDLMKVDAGGPLRQLRHQYVEVAIQTALQLGALVQLAQKLAGGDAQGVSGALHHSADGRLAHAQYERDAQHALAADQAHFQRPMGIQVRHQRNEAGKREVGMAVWLVCLAKQAAEDQLYRLAMIEHPVALSARDATEKMVGHCGRLPFALQHAQVPGGARRLLSFLMLHSCAMWWRRSVR